MNQARSHIPASAQGTRHKAQGTRRNPTALKRLARSFNAASRNCKEARLMKGERAKTWNKPCDSGVIVPRPRSMSSKISAFLEKESWSHKA